MEKLLTLIKQKRNSEQDLVIVKARRSYRKNLEASQQRFHEHYGQHSHSEIED